MAHPGGRPSIYTKELGQEICRRLSLGETLLQICKTEGMPIRETISDWILTGKDPEFSHMYAKARQEQANHLFDSMLEVADNEGKHDLVSVQRHRLMVDTRKWYISKVLPKIYGDKLDVTSDGKELSPTVINVVRPQDVKQHDDHLSTDGETV